MGIIISLLHRRRTITNIHPLNLAVKDRTFDEKLEFFFAHLYDIFFFSSRRRHTQCYRDWSSDVCSSDLDGVYHQGTVWAWLLGPFALAHFKAYGDAATARSFLAPVADHLGDHGVGSIAEIFDGDPPF